jgi:hypothetical protein
MSARRTGTQTRRSAVALLLAQGSRLLIGRPSPASQPRATQFRPWPRSSVSARPRAGVKSLPPRSCLLQTVSLKAPAYAGSLFPLMHRWAMSSHERMSLYLHEQQKSDSQNGHVPRRFCHQPRRDP